MKERNKDLLANTAILSIGQLVPKAISLIVLPLLTGYLSTTQYGTYDLILSVASLLLPIASLQIQQAVYRYLLTAKTYEEKESYISVSLIYIITSSFVIFGIVVLILMMMGYSIPYALSISLLYFFETLYNLLGQTTRGLGYNLKYSLGIIVYSAINCLAIIIFLCGLKFALFGVIVSLAFAYFVSDLYMFFSTKLYKYIKFSNIKKNILRKLLKFSAPIVPSSISLWIVNLSDRLLIVHFLGTAANGIYSVANKIPIFYSTAYSIFNLAWTETATKVSEAEDASDYYSSMFNKLYKFLIGIMLALLAVTPILFSVLVNKNYDAAFYQVPFLYFGIFFNSIVNFYSGIYIALKSTKTVGYSSLCGAIINLIINLVLIEHIGLYAASISTAVSYLIIVLYRAFDLRKRIELNYDMMQIIIGIILFVFSAIGCYTRTIIGMIVCIIIAAIYNFIFNEILKDLFKIIKKKVMKNN